MAKIYKGSLTKDHLGVALFLGGIGAFLVIMPLVLFYLWINSVIGAGTRLEDIQLNASVFVGLFLVASGACFYLVWRGVRERLIVDSGAMAYYATFFSKTIPIMDIEKVMIFDKERPVVIYNAGEDLKRLKLPVWKSNDYVDSLVADLKPMNPNIDVVDLRKNAGVEVRYEAVEQETGDKTAPGQ